MTTPTISPCVDDEARPHTKPVPILTVASGKGGVGKTSLALCLAREIAKSGRVLVVDLDYFNRGTTGLLQQQTSVLIDGVSFVEVLPLFPGARPASARAEDAEKPPIWVEGIEGEEQMLWAPCPELSAAIMRGIHDEAAAELASALRFLIDWLSRAHQIDCIILDTHGGPDPLSFAACAVSDDAILVTEPDKVTLYGTLNFLASLRDADPVSVGDGRGCEPRIHLIFNRVSSYFSWAGIGQLYDRDLKDLFTSLLAVVPFDEEIFDNFGSTPFITRLFPKSVFARKIALISRRLLVADRPDLVTDKVKSWSATEVERIHRRLHGWSLARPLSIAGLWLVAIAALFVISTAGALNPLGRGPLHDTVSTLTTLIALGSGGLAVASSLVYAARQVAKNRRFAENTPFRRLYAIKAIVNVVLIVLGSVVVLAGGVMLSSRIAEVVGLTRQREAARRQQCTNNLKQIGAALHTYNQNSGEYLPAYVLGPDGQPWHSWRVLVLPYLEQPFLFDAYNFGQPWNSPDNLKAAARMPNIFACPSDPREGLLVESNGWGGRRQSQHRIGTTNYLGTVGPNSVLRTPEPDVPFTGYAPLATDPNPIVVAESVGLAIPWTKPQDLDAEKIGGLDINPQPPDTGISSKHPGGANVVRSDGSVEFLPEVGRFRVGRDAFTNPRPPIAAPQSPAPE